MLHASLAWQALDVLLCLIDSTISGIQIVVVVTCTSLPTCTLAEQ